MKAHDIFIQATISLIGAHTIQATIRLNEATAIVYIHLLPSPQELPCLPGQLEALTAALSIIAKYQETLWGLKVSCRNYFWHFSLVGRVENTFEKTF